MNNVIETLLSMLDEMRQLLVQVKVLVEEHNYREALYKINTLKNYDLDATLLDEINKLENIVVNRLNTYKVEE